MRLRTLLCIISCTFLFQASAFERISVSNKDESIEFPNKTWLYIDSTSSKNIHDILNIPDYNWLKKDFDGFSEYPGWVLIPLINRSESPP